MRTAALERIFLFTLNVAVIIHQTARLWLDPVHVLPSPPPLSLSLALAQHATASYLSIIHTEGGRCKHMKDDTESEK